MSVESNIQYFSLQGISCAGCVRSVDKALHGLQQQYPSLQSFSINFVDRTAIIDGELSSQLVIQAIQNAGYDAALIVSEQDRESIEAQERKHLHSLILKSTLAITSGVLLMLLQMLGFLAPLTSEVGQVQGIVIAVLSAGVMVYSAANIYIGAWQNIKHLSFNMDILIALGTLSAWGYSILILLLLGLAEHFSFIAPVPLAAQHLYFEAAVMILGFILLGQVLEAKVRGNTAKAVHSLVNLQPKMAWRKVAESEFEQVPVPLLVPGDIVLVKPAEAIPVDGEVIIGTSVVDESMISGESLGIAKSVGDSLIGSTLNGAGSLTMRVTQVGEKTVLSQIISQVRQAQNSKPALGRLADKIAAVFVPVVLAIAFVTALIWWWYGAQGNWSLVLSATMTVLIIACPCALGLATPMSTMVGVGLAASKGILIQKGDALQVAQRLTTVVLDKTGTITQGKPQVTDILWLDNRHQDDAANELANTTQSVEPDFIWQSLLAIEQQSEHPLAQAVSQYCKSQLAGNELQLQAVQAFESHIGFGVSACYGQREVKAGSLNWLGNTLTQEQQRIASQWMDQAKSVVLFELDGRLRLMLAIADAIKEDSARAVEQLKSQGLKVVILSGDKTQSVAAIAQQVVVDEYHGELTPDQKLQSIKTFQGQGEVVAMVGDGVNDAPALAVADLGCAIGTGTDVAIHNADITLVRGNLTTLLSAIKVSKLTMRNIKQNLFAAFIYNIIAIPVAAGVLYPFFGVLLNPMIAGVAMALSSVTVVSNAYRLKQRLMRL